jgi:N-acetylglucosaminyl-diphospho-decaprenol L-rhamnosyltransferase
MSGPQPQVDVVVVSYNSGATLRGCVEPLCDLPGVSVTVVDNASPDDSAAVVSGLPVRVIHAERNGGFAYGCNIGAAAGSAPHLLLLNPDARIEPESLRALVAVLEQDASIGVAGPRILDEDGQLDWSQRRFPRLRSTFAQALFLQRVFPRTSWTDEVIRDAGAYERPAAPDWLSGACMLIRRTALEPLGGLDEGFFLYSEDTDLCRRMRSAGWGVRFEPAATARHEGGGSAPRHRTEWISARSRVHYARKHHGRPVAALHAAGVWLRALTHAVVWVHRPAIARGHIAAARATVAALRTQPR